MYCHENTLCIILWGFMAIKMKNLVKNYDIFLISAQNIDCGYWSGSQKYPQSIF